MPIFVTAEVGIESYCVPEDVVAAIERAARGLTRRRQGRFRYHTCISVGSYDAIQKHPGVPVLADWLDN